MEITVSFLNRTRPTVRSTDFMSKDHLEDLFSVTHPVVSLECDAEMAFFIKRNFDNIPTTSLPGRVIYYGDHAKFIFQVLRSLHESRTLLTVVDAFLDQL